MAACVIVNTLNGHDLSLNGGGCRPKSVHYSFLWELPPVSLFTRHQYNILHGLPPLLQLLGLILLTYTHIHPKNQQFFMPKIHVFSSLWMAMPSMNAKHTLNNNQIGWWIDLSLGVYGLSLFIWPFATIYTNLGIADRGDFWPIFLLMGIYWMI